MAEVLQSRLATGKPGGVGECGRYPEAENQLLEETRKLHIAPLLDHNYASRLPNPRTGGSPEAEDGRGPGQDVAVKEESDGIPQTIKEEPAFVTDVVSEGDHLVALEASEVKMEALRGDGEALQRDGEALQGDKEALQPVDTSLEALQPDASHQQAGDPDTKAHQADAKSEKPATDWQDEDYVTRCICGFDHDDGYMISCDKCMVWQHVDCMGVSREDIPDEYLCELCSPRRVDRTFAHALQRSKRHLFNDAHLLSNPRASSSELSQSEGDTGGGKWRRRREPKPKSNPAKRKKSDKPGALLYKRKKTAPKREGKPMAVEDVSEEEDEDSGSGEDCGSDGYEEASTNHYSPELRARVQALKAHAVHSPPGLHGAHLVRQRLRLQPLPPPDAKGLFAGCGFSPSQPIIEIRGKYMLDKTERTPNQLPPSNPSRFIFQHRLVGPGQLTTTVLVDTTTYGNAARFVRSSCYPNAQVEHCIEKGALHVYLVAAKVIEAGEELTLPHRPGAPCVLASRCLLLAAPWKRRSRKSSVVQESGRNKSTNLNNNIYKESAMRKASSSAEPKGGKSRRKGEDDGGRTRKSPIATQLKRNENKFLGRSSYKKP